MSAQRFGRPRRRRFVRPTERHGSLNRRLQFESLERRDLLAATPISVMAAGSTGAEEFQLQVDGVAVASFTNTRVLTASRVFDTFTYTHPTDVTIDRIRVAFTNDAVTPQGADRNLFVDAVTVAGVRFETEHPSVYSTGTWDPITNGRLPGYRETEALHYDGYFQYAALQGSTIQVRAAGNTGEEQMELQIGGATVATFAVVGGNYGGREFETFTYTHPTTVALNQIRVAFVNDAITPSGLDRNLRVDAVVIDGVRHETEGPDVYSTGTYIVGQGRVEGRLQTEELHLNGYFEYGLPAQTSGSVIELRAAGHTGEESLRLQVAGQQVAQFFNIGGNDGAGIYQTLTYVHPTTVAINQLVVSFVNDGVTAAGGDRNVRLDAVVIDGVVYQAEAPNVFSTATYLPVIGRMPGLWQNEYLHTNGDFQFGSSAVPGVLSLGTNSITVNEAAGTVSIPVVRTSGSDGTVGVQYTTVGGSAQAGGDFTARSGTLVFGPGETTKSIVVPIVADALGEPNETFNLAIDLAIGGASVLQPRTATITIVDDDGAAPPGNGNGLLGAYFNEPEFSQPALTRTDATINFNWGTSSPSGAVGADTYSVRWTGKIEPRFSETYTFRTTSDDGVRLWVNGQLIIDAWFDHGATDHFGAIALERGVRYDLKMEYYEATGSAVAVLAWSSPSQPLQVVPQSQLYSDPPPPPTTGTWFNQLVASGMIQPTAIDFAAGGRIFVAEQRGIVRYYVDRQLQPTPFLDIRNQVNNIQDRGMLGLAVHPNFPATPYVYVSYTYDPAETLTRTGNAGPDGGGNRVARVTRFTADAATNYATALPGSEVVIVGSNSTWANISSPHLDSTDNMTLPPSGGQNGELRDILIADSRSHTVGNVMFGPDGMLYVANGDGTSYGRVDPRTSRTLSINSLSGKILRVDPLTGAGLADNPFYNGDAGANRSKVYDYGLRNPFRFAFHPDTAELYIGDVGWTTWEEINVGRGKNFGWPFYEGGNGASLRTGGYQDLPEAQAYYGTNPAVTAPLWSRTHAAGGVAIVAGSFLHSSNYPTSFRNALVISDVGDNQLRLVRVNPDTTLNSVETLNLSVGFAVEFSMGPDGFVYYADVASGQIGRLEFRPTGFVAASTQPGDFDRDGSVNGGDFLAWQRNVGQPAGAIEDGDGDGVIAGGDLAVWRENYSVGAPVFEDPQDEPFDPNAFWLAQEDEDDPPANEAALEPPGMAPTLEPPRAVDDEPPVAAALAASDGGEDDATDEAFAEAGEGDDPLAWSRAF